MSQVVSLTNTDEELCTWAYGGSRYRLSIVGGILRLEHRVRGEWLLAQPTTETAAVMACALNMVRRAERFQNAARKLLRDQARGSF